MEKETQKEDRNRPTMMIQIEERGVMTDSGDGAVTLDPAREQAGREQVPKGCLPRAPH